MTITPEEKDAFKKKILGEMTVDYANNLQKNFDQAKQYVRITSVGSVDVLIKEKLNGMEQILLYLMGKMYAKEGGLTSTDEVPNEELERELQMKTGSLLPYLKELRDKNLINRVSHGGISYHSLRISEIENVLKTVEKKVK
jgi:hypothetical protein